MTNDQRREKRDAIVEKLAQLLTREADRRGPREDFERSVEVARLAIELARLKGSSDASAYVSEAARLLAGASKAVSDENHRVQTDRERALQHVAEIDSYPAAKASGFYTPFEDIVRAKGEQEDNKPRSFAYIGDDEVEIAFEWERPGMRAFADIVKRYQRTVFDDQEKKLHERVKNWPGLAGQDRARKARAQAILGPEGSFVDALAKARSESEAKGLLTAWCPRAEIESAREMIETVKAGEMNLAMLHELAAMREKENAKKSRKATEVAAKSPEAKAKRARTMTEKKTERELLGSKRPPDKKICGLSEDFSCSTNPVATDAILEG